MKFTDFKHYFSTARVQRYLDATSQSSGRAKKLYKANLTVSQSFHPLLGILEVVLRNKLNEVLSIHFQDSNWIMNQKRGFMSDPSLTFVYKKTGQRKTNDFLLQEISKAEKRIRKAGIPITSGKIIAEQTFGFWTDLFSLHHYRLLHGKPIQIFSSLPPGYGRKNVLDDLDNIRRFRNRINHNEPVCFKGNMIDFTQTLAVHQSIIHILSWINPDLIKLIKDLDKVQLSIKRASKI